MYSTGVRSSKFIMLLIVNYCKFFRYIKITENNIKTCGKTMTTTDTSISERRGVFY